MNCGGNLVGKSLFSAGLVAAELLCAGAARADAVYTPGQTVHGHAYDYKVNRVWWQGPSQLGVDVTVTGTMAQARISPFLLVNGQGRKVRQANNPAGQGFVNAVGAPLSVVPGQQLRANVFFAVGPGMQWDMYDFWSTLENSVPRVAVVR